MLTLRVLVFFLCITSSNLAFSESLSFNSKCMTSKFLNSTDKKKNLIQGEDFSRFGLDKLQKKTFSASNRFLVHYDTVGINAPSQIDLNKNNIPDYIDSVLYYFEYAYQKEVVEMGYFSPIPDNGLSGSDAYDVYIKELGNEPNGFYGFTSPESQPINPKIDKHDRFYSLIAIDNDYSPKDSTLGENNIKRQTYNETGIRALRITAVHEFHHAIQLMYASQDNVMMMELTSTSLENIIFPDSKDNLKNLNLLFRSPSLFSLSQTDPDKGYSMYIFNIYLFEAYNINILKNMWERMNESKMESLVALDSSCLKFTNKNLDQIWCEFMPWLYYTGNRSIEGKYFKFAKEYPLLKYENLSDTLNYNFNLYFQEPISSYSFNLLPYGFSTMRKIFKNNVPFTNDTLDLIGSYTNYPKAILHELDRTPSQIFLSSSFQNSFNNLGSTEYFYKFVADKYFCQSMFVYKGLTSNCISYVSPSPYIIDKDEYFTFNTPCSAKIFDKEKPILTLYNQEMIPFFAESIEVTLDKNYNRVAIWKDTNKILTSGVYLYSLIYGNDNSFGKFTVLNK